MRYEERVMDRMNENAGKFLLVCIGGILIFYSLGTWLLSDDFWLSTLVGWLCYGLCVVFALPFIITAVVIFEEYSGIIGLIFLFLMFVAFFGWEKVLDFFS